MTPPLEVVQRWHDALNADDIDALVALAAPDVEIVGPRGSAYGAAVVREWFGRANVHMIPLKFFVRGSIVVVDQRGEWLSADHSTIDSTQSVATEFVVENNLITKIARCPDLDSALAAAGLTPSDAASTFD